MHVAELWVYPVKSLAGQRLQRTEIGLDGVPGDRRLQVRDGAGRLVTARTRHGLLGLRATLGKTGEARVEDAAWDEPAASVRSTPRRVRAPAWSRSMALSASTTRRC